MSFIPTLEQQAIEQYFNSPGFPNLKVVARAGSGKTSTSCYLTNSTNRKGIYLAFGRKNALEARKKFPQDRVRVLTTHALAFHALNVQAHWGWKLLAGDVVKWPMWRIVQEFNIHKAMGVSAQHIAYAALQCVRRYMYSADNELSLDHCYDSAKSYRHFEHEVVADWKKLHPMATEAEVLKYRESKRTVGSIRRKLQKYQGMLLGYAKELWAAMISKTHPFPIEHDAYLKLYQLSKPKIEGISYLILDEAQDSNDCVFDIVMNQDCQIILIGDPAQGIFGFRRAKNVLDDLDAKTLYLSMSFRFGQAVADIANAILLIAYPDLVPIRGNPAIQSVIGPVSTPYALIARTNAGIFDEALRLAGENILFHVVGSLREPVDLARSVYHLWDGNMREVKNPTIRQFDDWEALKEESKIDVELSRYVRLIENKEDEVLDLCDLLESTGNIRADRAQVVLSTCHKAKGLEYERVRLTDDYRLKEVEGRIEGSLEEIHVAYVAATRAERVLELNQIGEKIMRKEKIQEFPILLSKSFTSQSGQFV